MKKITIFLLATFMAVTATTAQGQHRLPASHNNQHTDLLAHQRPVNAIPGAMAAAMRHAEDQQDVFNSFWTRDAVNPYGNAVDIPAVKAIDVRDFVMPLDRVNVSSPYGYRPRFGRMHRGVDLTLNVGDTVRSAFPGKVRLTKFDRNGYGYYVVVRHPNGMETVYGHLSRFLVQPDQEVKAGQPIALGGNTGRSTGPHLHFETRYLGLDINPAAIINFDTKAIHNETFTFNHQRVQAERRVSQGSRRSSARVSRSSGSRNRSASRRSGSRRRR